MGVTVGGRPTGPRISVILMPSMDSAWGELLVRTDEFAVIVVSRELPKVTDQGPCIRVDRTPRIYSIATGYEVFPSPRRSLINAFYAGAVLALPVGDNPIHQGYCSTQERLDANLAIEREMKAEARR